MKRDNKLKLHYNKKIKDIEGFLPLSENQGRWDIYLLFYHFISLKGLNGSDKNLLQELEERGYDITTINFSIEKAKENYQKIANKIGMNLTRTFKDWLFSFQSFGLQLKEINDSLVVLESNRHRLKFEKLKSIWAFKSETERPLYDSLLKASLNFLEFLNDGKLSEKDLKIFEEYDFLEALYR